MAVGPRVQRPTAPPGGRARAAAEAALGEATGGITHIGWSNILGHVVRGLGPTRRCRPLRRDHTGSYFSAASSTDQPSAETFFAVRSRPDPKLPSVGSSFFSGPYVTGTRDLREPKITGGGSSATEQHSLNQNSHQAFNQTLTVS